MARFILNMDALLFPLAIREAASYEGGSAQLDALGEALLEWKKGQL